MASSICSSDVGINHGWLFPPPIGYTAETCGSHLVSWPPWQQRGAAAAGGWAPPYGRIIKTSGVGRRYPDHEHGYDDGGGLHTTHVEPTSGPRRRRGSACHSVVSPRGEKVLPQPFRFLPHDGRNVPVAFSTEATSWPMESPPLDGSAQVPWGGELCSKRSADIAHFPSVVGVSKRNY